MCVCVMVSRHSLDHGSEEAVGTERTVSHRQRQTGELETHFIYSYNKLSCITKCVYIYIHA